MLIDKIVEDTATTVLDEVKGNLDAADFANIADTVLNKLESVFREGGLADNLIEMVTARIRNRYNIEDSNPDN
ncbi:hypothetical protein KAU11_08355 [Candidatus Babeliales bacterium]|nr:hypothetical protein [Candidatus Babeliales bacterium]